MVCWPTQQFYINNLMLLSIPLEYANISKYVITFSVTTQNVLETMPKPIGYWIHIKWLVYIHNQQVNWLDT